MNSTLLRDFTDPPSKYRGKPFWSWNGLLKSDELQRQIRVMKAMGMGGFFMHSRVGLRTPFLSGKWFEAVEACVDEARKDGMEAWLYDEDRWPSGAAGGFATKTKPQYRMRWVRVDVLKPGETVAWTPEVLAVFRAHVNGAAARGVERLRKGAPVTRGKDDRSIVVFRIRMAATCEWHNGGAYLDTMDHEAVQEFIRVGYEPYRRNCKAEFGATIPGMFTDEPNYMNVWDGDELDHCFPWSRSLVPTFGKRFGYDIMDRLMEIAFDVEGADMRARYDYHELTTGLFADAFARQIGEWCTKNGLLFTGHVLEEQLLSCQVRRVGSCMRFYEHMQAPGMDVLTQHGREYDTAKQVSSAAHQFGAQWRLSEMYGVTAWEFPLAGQKALGDWQAALGINLRCQHLSLYTLEGEAKRDFPASILHQSPWWEHYRHVEDYFSRIHAVMARGQEVRDILVIHPNESMWLKVKMGWRASPDADGYDRMLVDLRNDLLGAHLDFDYGDEDILARHGKVAGSRGTAVLVVAKARYRAVVVPPLVTIRSTTLDILNAFVKRGGLVVFAGEVPGLVDAVSSQGAHDAAARATHVAWPGSAGLSGALAPVCRRVSIADENGAEIAPALYLLREDASAQYLFVCNTGSPLQSSEGWPLRDPLVHERNLEFPAVTIRGFNGCVGAPEELDAQTGTVYAADAVRWGEGWEIRTSLPKIGTRLFVVPRKAGSLIEAKPRPQYREIRQTPIKPSQWNLSLSERNVLVLDKARYSLGNQPQRPAEDILRIDTLVRTTLGVAPNSSGMPQPWSRTPGPATVNVRLAYDIDVQTPPCGELLLALEQPARFDIRLNGHAVSHEQECGLWVDNSLRTLRIDPAVIRPGRNLLELTCAYDESHPGLESVFLLGDFGVKVDGARCALVAPPRSLHIGDWTGQGLPFYSGNVGYVSTIDASPGDGERVFVRVPGYAGAGVRILVNGTHAGIIAWEPAEVDITDFLSAGESTICLEVLGHRGNSHGPLHQKNRVPDAVGPGSFRTQGTEWCDEYQLVTCGLTEDPVLVVKRRG